MSDLTPVDSASCTASSSSSSRANSSPPRPPHVRKHSYTHVFPASSAGRKLSKPTIRGTRPADMAASTMAMDDRTRMLFSGLDWLLDMSAQPGQSERRPSQKPTPLSEKAISSFDASEEGRRRSAHGSGEQEGFKSSKTASWIDGQIDAKPSAPY